MSRFVMQLARQIAGADTGAGEDHRLDVAARDAGRIRLVLRDAGEIWISLGDGDTPVAQLRRDRAREAPPEQVVAIDHRDTLDVQRVDGEARQRTRRVVVGRATAADPAVDALDL